MKEFFISSAVAAFGFLYSFGALLQDLGGPRMRRFLALLSLGSVYIAFTYRPNDAIDIVLKPAQALADLVVESIRGSLPAAPTTTTTP